MKKEGSQELNVRGCQGGSSETTPQVLPWSKALLRTLVHGSNIQAKESASQPLLLLPWLKVPIGRTRLRCELVPRDSTHSQDFRFLREPLRTLVHEAVGRKDGPCWEVFVPGCPLTSPEGSDARPL